MDRYELDGRVRMRGYRYTRFLAPIVVAVAAGALLIAPGAKSTTTCALISNYGLQVSSTGAGTTTISRDTSGSLLSAAAIRVNGTACGTVGTVDKIIFTGDAANQALVIDQLNGAFAPGRTSESTGIAEIEFEINGGAGADSLGILGQNGATTIALGTLGGALNTDADSDITILTNFESFGLEGRGADDVLTGQGGFGAGSAFASPLTLIGAGGNDKLTGGNANDTLKPGLGNDTVVNGGLGNNTVDYSDNTAGVKVNLGTGVVTGHGNDTVSNIQNVTTGSGPDEAWDPPAAQRNVFILGAGDDFFHSNALRPSGDAADPVTKLSDRILGQAGIDKSEYIDAPHNSPGLTFDLPSNKVTGSDEYDENDSENIIGSTGDDTFVDEDGQQNDLQGGDGNDFFKAGVKKPVDDAPDADGHSDNYDGGNGIDTVSYEQTEHHSPGVTINFLTDRVNGSPQYDTIPNVENADGSTGDDTCMDQDGQQNICRGGEGDDRFEAGVAKPVNDAPDASGKSDTWDGGPGNDTVSYAQTEHHSPGVSIDFITNQVHGSPEYDEIPGVENAEGSTGDDTCTDADGERNSCSLGEGNDTVIAGVAKPANDAPDANGVSDHWDGGPGDNTLSYAQTEHHSPGVTIDQLVGQVHGSPEYDEMSGFCNFIGSTGDDVLINDPNCVTHFDAGIGNDVVELSGAATIGSEFHMGADLDKLKTSAMTAPVIDVNMPADLVTAGGPSDFFDGEDIDNAGSTAQVNVVADDNANVLQGGSGGDTINGAGGDDTIRGGDGNDVIDCGTGNADIVSWEDSPNPVIVTMSDVPGSGTATGYGNDSFVNCEEVHGSNNNDRMIGAGAKDNLHGADGDDYIEGNNGEDELYGDAGNDTILGGNNNDTIYGGDGNDFGDGGNSNDTIFGGAGDDELHGGSNGGDTVYGESGNDHLFGDNGPDTLDGGEGADIVDGGEGPDRCAGENEQNCEL